MTIYQLGEKKPQFLGTNYFVANNAIIIGDVVIGNNVSIWFSATVRGDLANITIANDTNIQDNCVLHVDYDLPLIIKEGVTVGHAAVLHSCTVGRNCLIGMNSVILNGVQIGENCIIGANALITQSKIIPDGSLILGSPAKVVRQLNPEEIQQIKFSKEHYIPQRAVYKDKLASLVV